MEIPEELNSGKGILSRTLESLDDFLVEGVFLNTADNALVFANTPFVKMFGYNSLCELQSIPFDWLYADDEARIYLIDKIKVDGIITKHRILCRRNNGSNFWGLVSGKKVMMNNRVFYEGRIHDISCQIYVEEKLKQKEIEMDKLTMELDRFMYSASHEIRSPVSTLLGILNLMRHDLKDGLAQQYIQMMQTGIDKLDQIVHQLTAHVKNTKNRVEDRYIDFQLTLEEILGDFRQNHPSFNMVESTFEVIDSGVFHSDPDRIRLILYNILKNSFDYIDSNKTIRVLSIVVRTGSEKAIIEIFDNGIGIPSMHVNRVFDMFYRATSLTKGSGIGLYTVRESVTKLCGVIVLHSEYGVGTSVKIELPNSKKGRLINKKKLLRSIKP